MGPCSEAPILRLRRTAPEHLLEPIHLTQPQSSNAASLMLHGPSRRATTTFPPAEKETRGRGTRSSALPSTAQLWLELEQVTLAVPRHAFSSHFPLVNISSYQ